MDTFFIDKADGEYSVQEADDTLQKYIRESMPRKVKEMFEASKDKPYTESDVVTIVILKKVFRAIFSQVAYKHNNKVETRFGLKKIEAVDQSMVDTEDNIPQVNVQTSAKSP